MFTVTLDVDSGNGWEPAQGELVDITVKGSGEIVEIAKAGPDEGTCQINAAGTCTVTVNNDDPGSLVITATYEAAVGETTHEYSDSGTKTWYDPPHPPTGSDSGWILRVGGFLALAGLALLLLARRRRTVDAAA